MSTREQAEVGKALSALKFESVPLDDKPGGPEAWAVTHKTIKYLRGTTFVVDGDGEISVKDRCR